MPDLPAIEDIGGHVHDSFFRAMLADPVRANGVIRAHWPRQLRWLPEGAPARQVDSTLGRDDLRQFRTDALFLVGGEGSRPNALFLPEHKFGAVARTPRQLRDYARTVLDGLDLADSLWLVSMVFDTGGDGGWNVLGVIDETSDDPPEILVQMRQHSAYFARQTPRIRYGNLSREAVSRAMLGVMGSPGGERIRGTRWRGCGAGMSRVAWPVRRCENSCSHFCAGDIRSRGGGIAGSGSEGGPC